MLTNGEIGKEPSFMRHVDAVEYRSRSMTRGGKSHPLKKAALVGYIMLAAGCVWKIGETGV